jgi:zinc transport system substrate-binding protein
MVLILMAAVVLAGCGASEDGGEADAGTRAAIVAGFYPLAWAAEQVAGEGAEVTNLTPPGAEPHDLELSARDVERIGDADLVLLVGAGFQPALENAAADAEARVFDALDGLELLDGSDEHGHEEEPEDDQVADESTVDPHFWLDALLFARIVERLGAELGREDAAASLAADLRALHRDFAQGLADCERRQIVTSHAAFGYLAARYDLEQISVTGLSPEAEPTPRELEEVVEHVREAGATTVFFETLVSPRIAETVAREAGAETGVLNPLEGLTAEEVDAGADYVSLMRDNLAALRAALACR